MMRDIFSAIYQSNYWRDRESLSGRGSNMRQTVIVREKLPKLLASFGVRSVLDIPCGDFYWLSQVELRATYIGADIVPELVYNNRHRYPGVDFRVLDVTTDRLPLVDLVLCRDLLGHFSNRDVKLALRNLRRSGSTFLLATTFPEHENDGDIETGQWRPINLAVRFGLPNPIGLLNEHCTEGDGSFADKSLGLWRLNERA